MGEYSINEKDVIFSLDIGTRTVIGTVGVVKDGKFNIIAEKCIEHSERAMIDGQIHNINVVSGEVISLKRELEEEIGMELHNVAIAAAGRFLKTTTSKTEIDLGLLKDIDKELVRGLELTAVKEAEKSISQNINSKLYCVGYSVKNYYLNGYVISSLLSHKGDNIGVEVICTFLPRSVVDSLYSVMEKSNLKVKSLTLEPIAAMEAVVPKSFRLLNIALIDIGAGTSDIAISNNDSIIAYGMVPQAGDEITEVIAKNYLVDFNTAELIKRNCTLGEKVKYKDVLGMENEMESEGVIKSIKPVVDKITGEIANKVIELNGGKSPSAVFLVGGGAYTCNLPEILAEKLQLQPNRIAIKNRKDVVNCLCKDNKLDSIGVTVLGIALEAIEKAGKDFIDVILNNKVVSLFNSHSHSVKEVMLQAGINPKVLIGKNGENVRFILNDTPRIAFGELGTRSEIKVNSTIGNMDTEVHEGDNIKVEFAKRGKKAMPKVYEYLKTVNTVSFYINEKLTNMEPVALKKGEIVSMEYIIKDNDEINIIYPSTLGEYKKYIGKEELKFFMNSNVLEDTYVIKEGDKIYTEEIQDISINEIDNYIEKENIEKENTYIRKEEIKKNSSRIITIEVIVNGQKVIMNNKEKYVFIDVFDYINFDLSVVRGKLVLLLNGNNASYYDEISHGDIITVAWE
ncbi:cell division FtsA domain-containing protein [Clostridium sp. KNHs214]|uniref:cell division protein FtsA n=1 Tax=Clostridium sp. KNHs214 TaxID=1540257 RepID=UPI00054EC7D6|nr:cell division FtsA domain-containing protein [Clostridium sp. KNHs214]